MNNAVLAEGRDRICEPAEDRVALVAPDRKYSARHAALCVSTVFASGLSAALAAGADPDGLGEDGLPLLSQCASRLWVDGVRLLLASGASATPSVMNCDDAPVAALFGALLASTRDAEIDEIASDVARSGEILDLLLAKDSTIRVQIPCRVLSGSQETALAAIEDRLRRHGHVAIAGDVHEVLDGAEKVDSAGVRRFLM